MNPKDFIKQHINVSEEDYAELLINPKLMCDLMENYHEVKQKEHDDNQFKAIVQVQNEPHVHQWVANYSNTVPSETCIICGEWRMMQNVCGTITPNTKEQVFNPCQTIIGKP